MLAVFLVIHPRYHRPSGHRGTVLALGQSIGHQDMQVIHHRVPFQLLSLTCTEARSYYSQGAGLYTCAC